MRQRFNITVTKQNHNYFDQTRAFDQL